MRRMSGASAAWEAVSSLLVCGTKKGYMKAQMPSRVVITRIAALIALDEWEAGMFG
jgi:hypothetical protein